MLILIFASSAFAETGSLPYEALVTGVSKKPLRILLESVSETCLLQKEGPVSRAMLAQRMESDRAALAEALRSRGYFSARISNSIDQVKNEYIALHHVTRGPCYSFGRIDIIPANPDAPSTYVPPDYAEIGLAPGEPFESARVKAAEKAILTAAGQQGFAFARMASRRVKVDHSARAVVLEWRIDPGPQVLFGNTVITGLSRVKPNYVQNLATWTRDSIYEADRVSEFRTELQKCGLFSLISVQPEWDSGNRADMQVSLRERKHRTAAAGVGYRTDEGYGIQSSWENRNLWGGAENVYLSGLYAENRKLLDARFTKPQFVKPRQDLILEAEAEESDVDAYFNQYVQGSVDVERRFRKSLTGRLGTALRVSRVETDTDNDHYVLFSVPVRLKADKADDLLNPTTGHQWTIDGEPFFNLNEAAGGFFKHQYELRAYGHPGTFVPVTLAGRAMAGSIAGAARDDIPADLRFYSGGGGSVRGYPYQSLGPLAGDTPLGGNSIIEVSGEVRGHFSANTGYVIFLDGGTTYDNAAPDNSEPFRWGAGAGFRYFTPVGPVRLDVGIPLDRREDIDDPYQFYISVGQAF